MLFAGLQYRLKNTLTGKLGWKWFFTMEVLSLFAPLPLFVCVITSRYLFFCGALLGCQCRTDFSNFSSLIAKTFIKLSNNFKQSIYLPVVLLSHLPSSRQFLGVETSQ